MARCLGCSPKVCGEWWLYVVADKDGSGPVKVGTSSKPTRRLAQHRKKTGRDLAVHFKRSFRCEFAACEAEERVTATLDAWRTRGDWFDRDVADVVAVAERTRA